MPVLEPVVAILTANTEQFIASLDKAKLAMEDTAVSGAATGSALGGDLATGAAAAEQGLGDAEQAAKDGEKATKDLGEASKATKDKVTLLGSAINNLPGPLGDARDKTKQFGNELEHAKDHGAGVLGMLSAIPTPALLAGAAIAGTAAVAVDLGSAFQTTTNQIAASEGITTTAAAKIGNAFLSTAGQTTLSAQQIASSFAKYAGQAKSLNGGALSAKQSMELMQAAMDGAEATGGSLDATTKGLLGTLQAFQMPVSKSSEAMNALYVAGNATGQGIQATSKALTMARSRLGDTAPPLSQLSALLVDLTNHGETGRAAMTALSTTFTSFLKPATAVATAHKNLKIATDNLPPSLDALAKQYATGTMHAADVTSATKGLDTAQSQLWGKFKSASDAARIAGEAYQKLGFNAVGANGKLLPMGEIIGKLHDQIKGMGAAQAQATLSAEGFGSSAAKIVATVQAGPAAFEKYKRQIEEHDAAAQAAAKATSGLKDTMEKAKVMVEDMATRLGVALIPTVTAAAKMLTGLLAPAFNLVVTGVKIAVTVIQDVVRWFKQMSAPAIAIAAIITATLIPTFVRLGISAVTSLAQIAASMGESMALSAAYAAEWVVNQFKMMAATAASTAEMIGFQAQLAAEWVVNQAKMVASAAEGTAEMIASGATWMAEQAANVAETIALWAMQAAEWAVVAAAYIAENVAMAAAATAAFIAENAATLGIVAGIAVLVGAIVYMATHWKQVWNFIKSAAVEAWHMLEGIWHGIVSVFETAIHLITSHLKMFGEIMLVVLLGPLGLVAALFIHFWSDIKKYTAEGIHAVVGFFTRLPGEIVHALDSVGKEMLSIGGDIIHGLIHGIESAAKSLPGTMLHIAESAVLGPFKSIMGIFSPSTVFAEFGGNMMQGLGKGIKNNKNAAADELKNLKLGNELRVTLNDIAADGIKVSKSLNTMATAMDAMGRAGKTSNGNIKGAKTAIEEIGKALAEVGKAKIGGGFAKELSDIANIGKLGPVMKGVSKDVDVMGHAFMNTGHAMFFFGAAATKTHGDLKPASTAIEGIAKALSRAGSMKFSSDFTKQVEAVATLTKSLAPGPVTKGIEALRTGLVALGRTKIGPMLEEDGKSLERFSVIAKPSATSFQALAKVIATFAKETAKAKNEVGFMVTYLLRGDQATSRLATALKVVETAMRATSRAISDSAKTMSNNLAKALDVDEQKAKHLDPVFKAVANSVTDGAKRIAATAKEWHTIGSAIDAVGKSLSGMGKAISDISDGLHKSANSASNLNATLKKVVDNVGEASKAVTKVATNWTSTLQTVNSATVAFFSAMQVSLTNFGTLWDNTFHGIDTSANSWLNQMANIMQQVGDKLSQGGTDAMNRLKGAVDNGKQQTINSLNNLASQMQNAVGSTSQVTQFYNIGQSLMQGLANGIGDSTNGAVTAISSAVNQIVSTLKTKTKTNSPSLLFHEFGSNFMEGLALGITDNEHLATNAISGAAAGMSMGITGGVSGVAPATFVGGGGGGTTVLNVTTPIEIEGRVLAQVVTQYQLINARSTGNVFGRYSGGSQTGAATGINVNAISR